MDDNLPLLVIIVISPLSDSFYHLTHQSQRCTGIGSAIICNMICTVNAEWTPMNGLLLYLLEYQRRGRIDDVKAKYDVIEYYVRCTWITGEEGEELVITMMMLH